MCRNITHVPFHKHRNNHQPVVHGQYQRVVRTPQQAAWIQLKIEIQSEKIEEDFEVYQHSFYP